MLHRDIYQCILEHVHFEDIINALIAFKLHYLIDVYIEKFVKISSDKNDNIIYSLPNGKLHRNKLPALIYNYGSLVWYKRGIIYRDNDLPAYIYRDGTLVWYKDGKKHRDNDLPALIGKSDREFYKNGICINRSVSNKYFYKWYNGGKRHRENDMPAVMSNIGYAVWYKNNKIHRENDKPALINYNGNMEWHQHNKLYRDHDMPVMIFNKQKKINSSMAHVEDLLLII